jgi:hypothetical protein
MNPIYRAEDVKGSEPVLALDIDGVLVAWANDLAEAAKLKAKGYTNEGDNLSFVYHNPELGEWLNALIPEFQVVYCTDHHNNAHKRAGSLLGLAEFDYVLIPYFSNGSTNYSKEEGIRRTALGTLFPGRPLVWAEDEATEADHDWARSRSDNEAPTLLIQPDLGEGLTRQDIDKIHTWLGELAA